VAVITITFMKTLQNILDTETINTAVSEVESLRHTQAWGISNYAWPGYLLKDSVIGGVSFAAASPHLTEKITEILISHVPISSRIIVEHYLWYPLSGINMHVDNTVTFGATIYLTPQWNINWGGLFVHKEQEELKVIFPTFNSININNEDAFHMVTTVSPLAPHPRYTLQIWGVR